MKSNYSLFLIATTSLTVVLSLFGSPASAQLSKKPQTNLSVETKNPNVLFISIDDLNDWIGCLGGHPQAKTPNLDRLATRGTLFLNAHCQSPVCIHEANAGEVGPHFTLEKTMRLDAFQAWLREGPVDIPGEAGRVLAIISSNRWQDE